MNVAFVPLPQAMTDQNSSYTKKDTGLRGWDCYVEQISRGVGVGWGLLFFLATHAKTVARSQY